MTTKRSYIGLAAGVHDSALAIVDNAGCVVFAEATERYLQYKRAYNCGPDLLLRLPELIRAYCEPNAELVLATTWNRRHMLRFRSTDDLLSLFGVAEPLKEYFGDTYAYAPYSPRWLLASLVHGLRHAGSNVEFLCQPNLALGQRGHRVARNDSFDHHLTHAATACFTSPFSEGACAIIDGFGEQRSVSFYHYRAGTLTPLGEAGRWSPRPRAIRESLGLFYAGLCSACGFDALKGEEWKVMGLAPYGRFSQPIYQLLRPLLDVRGLELVGCAPAEFARRMAQVQAIGRQPGQPALEMADLAHTGQQVFADVMAELLNNLYTAVGSDNLILGGGCGLNSSWNGQILDRTRFRRLHVFAAPADDGNALGAALLAFQQDRPDWRPTPESHSPYLGSNIGGESLANLVRFGRIGSLRHMPGEVQGYAARLLAEGKIIGWVQGRAEFGPRSLGNRSILADPRPADMKERINAQVKFRGRCRQRFLHHWPGCADY